MEVTVNWTRTEYYRSTITIPDDEVQDFADLDETAEKPVEVTSEIVKDWLENGNPSEHLEAKVRDWLHAEEPQIDDVEI
jgi:hypothetical protein